MSGFKLLAIRPMKGNPQSLIRNLKEGIVYRFYNDFQYEYVDSEKALSELKNCVLNHSFAEDIYKEGKQNINISAIVGKNGSGKSSLIELYYAVCYCISVADGEIEDFNGGLDQKKIGSHKLIENIFSYNKISCEVYFSKNKTVCRINLNDGKYIWEEYEMGKWNVVNFKYSDFAYSIANNYSIYGLNSNDHLWISSLFHKNDGYQIPLVINPYRKEGIIDVNSELHLAQSRILLNLSASIEEKPIIVNSKSINSIDFIMDICENDSIRISPIFEHSLQNILENHQKIHEENIFELFNKISSAVVKYKLNNKEIEDLKVFSDLDKKIELKNKFLFNNIIKEPLYYEFKNPLRIKYEFIKYVVRKAIKICINYPAEFGENLVTHTEIFSGKVPEIKNSDNLVKAIIEDHSHITLKLRQALTAIKERYFETNNWILEQYSKDSEKISLKLNLDWKIVKDFIKKSERKTRKRLEDRLDLIPGAFVKPILKIKEAKNDYSYNFLSSGEQQLANTIQTIIYHLYNLNSVHRSRGEKIKYNYVNIILDEIELYFHPEFQRQFIYELINSIKRLNLNKVYDINILLATHSPFILSDIPNSNILKLKNGKPELFSKDEQTFGSNIYDLLHNDFFLENGFIGAFAKSKISEIIEFLKLKESDITDIEFNRIKDIVDLIGEPIIKNKLTRSLQGKFPTFYLAGHDLNKRIEIQEELLRKLKAQIKKR